MTQSAAQNNGLVIASYGQRGRLETDSGQTLRFILKGRKLRAVCGDRVTWSLSRDGSEAIVQTILPRKNSLSRPGNRGNVETLASNLDKLCIVSAPQPAPDLFLIDRFICAAELMHIPVTLIWNKEELASDAQDVLSEYVQLGYPVLSLSAHTGAGMDQLEQQFSDSIGILVGQSGVGKSSLINVLIPNADERVNTLSEASGEGRHTTTAAVMHTLRGGGRLIDSPGVREFQPAIEVRNRIQDGFREMNKRAGQCRFSNCQHMREPGCAIKDAVEAGAVSARRYASYKRLYNSSEELQH